MNRHLFPGRGELDSVSLLSFNKTGKLDGVSALEKLKLPFRELCHNVTFEGVNESDAPFPPQGGESLEATSEIPRLDTFSPTRRGKFVRVSFLSGICPKNEKAGQRDRKDKIHVRLFFVLFVTLPMTVPRIRVHPQTI